MNIKEFQSLINGKSGEILLRDNINLKNNSCSEIIIDSDSLIIDADYHSITRGNSLLFELGGEDITLKNMIFEDFNLGYDSLIINNSSVLNLDSCVFKSCTSYRSIIINNSNLRLDNCQFIDNTFDDEGVLIYNNGSLDAVSTFFKNNIAMLNDGATIVNDSYSTCNIINSIFKNNKADYGSCIYNMENTDTIVKNSTFYENTVEYEGGAIFNKSTMKIINSTFKDNKAFKGDALYNEGKVTIKSCEFSSNIQDSIFNDTNAEIKIK